MKNRKQQLDEFFNQYCVVFNTALSEDNPDLDQTTKLFSDCFIAANPSGVNCGKNDKQFLDAMIKGYAFYKTIGITSMEIISKEITILDDFHAMVKILWKSNVIRKDGTKVDIRFTNVYFTQTKENNHKVFAYITGDEQAALKASGLI